MPVPVPETLTDSHAELKTPTGSEVDMAPVAAAPTLALLEESPSRPSISLDTILNQEVHCLASDIKSIMQTHHVAYASRLPPRLQPSSHSWSSNRCFSKFVAPYVSPVATHAHVRALWDTMEKLVPVVPPTPPPTAAPLVASPPPQVLATPPATPAQAPAARTETPTSKSATQSTKDGGTPEATPARARAEVAAVAEPGGEVYSPSRPSAAEPSAEPSNPPNPPNPSNPSNPGHAPSGKEPALLGGGLIGQLKPEMFSSLVEIFKDVTKNTVKFYIYSSEDGEESAVCRQIKVRRRPSIVERPKNRPFIFRPKLFWYVQECWKSETSGQLKNS